MQNLFDTGTTYEQALDKLNKYFAPKKNVAFIRHMFRQSKQEDEKEDNFIVLKIVKAQYFV